jgi:hypothetical protein
MTGSGNRKNARATRAVEPFKKKKKILSVGS